jgi:hypothetical protein
MLTLLASLLIAQAQPAPPIDWEARPASEPAPATEPTFDEALAASYAADDKAAPKGRLGFRTLPPTQPQTEAERIAAANAAAIARAEQAGKDTNATTPWPDDGKMRCKPTESGFVCGNSEKALEPDSPSRQALDNLLNKPN